MENEAELREEMADLKRQVARLNQLLHIAPGHDEPLKPFLEARLVETAGLTATQGDNAMSIQVCVEEETGGI